VGRTVDRVRTGAGFAAGLRRVPAAGPVERPGVRVDKQLGGVEAMAQGRRPGPVDAVAVALPGTDAGGKAVPAVTAARRQRQARELLRTAWIEQAKLYLFRMRRIKDEVGPFGRAGCARPGRVSGKEFQDGFP